MQEKEYTNEEKVYKEFTSWLKADPDMNNIKKMLEDELK